MMYTETNHFDRDPTCNQINKHDRGSRNSHCDDDSLWDDDVNENQVAGFHSRDHCGDNDSDLSSSSSSSSSLSSFKNTKAISRLQKHEDRADYSVIEQHYKEHDGSTGSVTSSVSSVASSSSAVSVQSVLDKLEDFILKTVIIPLSEEIPNHPSAPEINACSSTISFKRKLSLHHLSQARSLASIIMVASFCYDLLAPPRISTSVEDHHDCNTYHLRKTTTAREVYYFYVTHFRDQRECDKAIWDLVCILELPSRQCLGIVASPRGWFCGSINIYNAYTNELKFNGRELDAHGMAITPSTYDNYDDATGTAISRNRSDDINLQHLNNSIRIESDARCILVVEKEGVYTRLSEDKFFLRYLPCILVTGKGFPDVATRRWVRRMKMTLKIPVYGLCDCNPYGVSVLDSYRHDQGVRLSSKHQQRESLELHWIGLRPSQVETMDLPSEVFQELSKNDHKRLNSLLVSNSSSKSFADRGRNRAERVRELEAMRNYKVELEALHWKGADYLSRFVSNAISEYERNEMLTSG